MDSICCILKISTVQTILSLSEKMSSQFNQAHSKEDLIRWASDSLTKMEDSENQKRQYEEKACGFWAKVPKNRVYYQPQYEDELRRIDAANEAEAQKYDDLVRMAMENILKNEDNAREACKKLKNSWPDDLEVFELLSRLRSHQQKIVQQTRKYEAEARKCQDALATSKMLEFKKEIREHEEKALECEKKALKYEAKLNELKLKLRQCQNEAQQYKRKAFNLEHQAQEYQNSIHASNEEAVKYKELIRENLERLSLLDKVQHYPANFDTNK